MGNPNTPLDTPVAHLKDFPGLFVRVGADIQPAPEADQVVARGYPQWQSKGPLIGDRRITILSSKTTYLLNEEIKILHVAETVRPDDELYAMGPKQIFGEHVDGKLVTQPLPPGDDPLIPPGIYDGLVLSSPAVDYNYEITSYRFAIPGGHEIQWKLGALESNVLRLRVQ